jgi:predicted O-linked N-acetylglucosamine transferase (SPINDLY family)
MGKLDEAVASYQKALAIKPDYAEVHCALGLAFYDLGKLDEAVASCHKALAITPDYTEAHNNLGNALQDLGKLDEAMASYRYALAVRPDYAEAHNNIGGAFLGLGDLDAAVGSYRKALAIMPEYAEAHNNLGLALEQLGKVNEAIASYRRALAIRPDFADARTNIIFTLLHIPKINGEDILQEALQWQAQCGFTGDIPKHRNARDPDRRLRIGFLSGDLYRHPVSCFLEKALSEIDKDKLEIFAYATTTKEDDVTARLKAIVPHWRQAGGRSDQQLAEDITADEIDILVDLSGHTAHNRLALMSRKPAPIQVSWLGSGGPTGIAAIDYVLCDPVILPACDEGHFTEKPWRLPDIWMCYSPPAQEIEVRPPPALANGYITFGSFNSLIKVSDETVACWARILEAVPNSRLLIKAKQLADTGRREHTFRRFESHGVDRHRLAVKSQTPSAAEHFRDYGTIDIALDPFPYAGGTTTVEALWMGTPVLTLKGQRFVSRMGESLVHNAGLDPWIANTPEDYVEKAKAFAADLPALAALRASLRGQLLASPVCDAARFARNLEDAFGGMWRQWCAKMRT